jgi:hypothetical protein
VNSVAVMPSTRIAASGPRAPVLTGVLGLPLAGIPLGWLGPGPGLS